MKKKILIVEDDAAISESLRELLELEGYQVLQAMNGLEALNVLGEVTDVDLLLLDLMMPEMDGQEFLREREKRALIANVPVIVISAASYVNPDPERIYHFLRKPLDVDRLLGLIGQLI